MADAEIINGVPEDARTMVIDGVPKNDEDDAASFDRLAMIRKIEGLELEKVELERQNDEIKKRVGNLTAEIEALKNDKAEMSERLGKMEGEIEQWESDKRAAEAIAARAVELESEVSRLQHDLISSMTEGDDAKAEVVKVKSLLEEKASQLENLEKEKVALFQALEKARSELESMVVKVRDESAETVGNKEIEISGLKKRIEELEHVVAKSSAYLESIMEEKESEAAAKTDAVETAKRESGKVGVLESKLRQVTEELEESKRAIMELKEKAVGAINGVATNAREGILGSEGKASPSLKVQWPAVAASAGTVVAVAVVVYLRYGKRR